MMLEPETIEDAKILTQVLRNFDVELIRLPALPVSLHGLVEFLKAEGIEAGKIDKLVRHINANVEIFTPMSATRDRLIAHIWREGGLTDELFWARRRPIVTRSSKIVSLGGPFAAEMAQWLQINGYTYLVKEPDFTQANKVQASSAQWGVISNAVAFSQVVNWAFGSDEPPYVTYRTEQGIFDLFREGIIYSEEELPHLEDAWRKHLACARAALCEAEIIVLMLEMNEVYRYLPTSHYLHHTPRINPALWEAQLLNVEDTVEILKAAIEQLQGFNPSVQFIVGVSPIPLLRTFRSDIHVAAAASHSKAILRVALEQLCESFPRVHYMAALETVMYAGRDLDVWSTDERHIAPHGMAKVMALFQQQFCSVEEGLRAARELAPASASADNPYFETDHKIFRQALEECVKRGLIDAEQAIEMLNRCTLALYRNAYDPQAYAFLRMQSIKSRFNFNRLCREIYRETFPTSFARTGQSDAIQKGLQEEGYFVVPPTPQSRQFAALMLKAMAAMPVTREVDGKVGLFSDLATEDVPRGFRFHVHEDALPVAPAVKLLEDLGVLRGIGEVLGHPILRNVHAWYSVRPSGFVPEDIFGSAHEYHADNDTPTGWIKVFIYLTDVSEETGPHGFAPRSHLKRPPELSRDRSFKDWEVERHFGPGVTFPGPAGTIIVENTEGLHKALPVQAGMRAIFQLEYVNCLFGAATERHRRAEEILEDLPGYDSRFLLRYLRDCAVPHND